MPFIFDKRERIAQSGTLLSGALMALCTSSLLIRYDPPLTRLPIQVTLAEPPAPAEPPRPLPPIERPRPAPSAHNAPAPATPEPLPQPALPVVATPSPAPAPVTVPDSPVSPIAKTRPEKFEPPRPRSNAASEGRFAQEVRSSIERKKLYPDTARELGMTGTAEVVYVLNRSGALVRAEIALSSGYPLLDQAALRAVQSTTYAPFPEDAWVEEHEKQFRTRLVFTINY